MSIRLNKYVYLYLFAMCIATYFTMKVHINTSIFKAKTNIIFTSAFCILQNDIRKLYVMRPAMYKNYFVEGVSILISFQFLSLSLSLFLSLPQSPRPESKRPRVNLHMVSSCTLDPHCQEFTLAFGITHLGVIRNPPSKWFPSHNFAETKLCRRQERRTNLFIWKEKMTKIIYFNDNFDLFSNMIGDNPSCI